MSVKSFGPASVVKSCDGLAYLCVSSLEMGFRGRPLSIIPCPARRDRPILPGELRRSRLKVAQVIQVRFWIHPANFWQVSRAVNLWAELARVPVSLGFPSICGVVPAGPPLDDYIHTGLGEEDARLGVPEDEIYEAGVGGVFPSAAWREMAREVFAGDRKVIFRDDENELMPLAAKRLCRITEKKTAT